MKRVGTHTHITCTNSKAFPITGSHRVQQTPK